MREKKQSLLQSIIFLIVLLSNTAAPVFAENKQPDITASSQPERTQLDAPHDLKKSLINSTFVLQTDQESAAESLERISGKVDMGFSAPEDTYKTEERPGAGPFAKEKAEEKKQTTAAY